MKIIFLLQFPVIHPETMGSYFSRIYLLAFFVVLLAGLVMGFRKKIPQYQLWLSGFTLVMFFILGTRVLTFSAWEWQQLFSLGQWPEACRKTVLGGLAGRLFGILLVAWWIRPHKGFLDMIAVISPVGLAIQRIGCLFTGCCFGSPTHLPWGISYSQSSPVWLSQLHTGLIHPVDIQSCPVHPAQIYDLLCCLLIIAVMVKAGKYFKATGNLLLLATVMYCFFRFFIEFIRDPVSDLIPGAFMGIKYTQWWILAGIMVLVPVIVVRERLASTGWTERVENHDNFTRSISLFATLVVVFLLTRNLYDLSERLVLLSMLCPLTIMTAFLVLKRFTIPGLRLATVLILIGVVILTGQTYVPTKPGERVRYLEVNAGNTIGTFYNEYKAVQQQLQIFTWQEGGGCGDTTIYAHTDTVMVYAYGKSYKFRHQTYLGGASISFKKNVNRYKRLEVGSGFYMGEEVSSVAEIDFTEKNFVYVINPFLRYDWRWFGFKGGIYLGNFNLMSKETGVTPSPATLGQNTGELTAIHAYPQFALRFGPYDIAFLEVHFADHLPQGNPVWPLSFGVGTGLGKVNGTRIGVGYSTSGVYADCYLPLRERFVLQGGVASNFKSGMDNVWSASVGFAYRFGYKTIMKNKK